MPRLSYTNLKYDESGDDTSMVEEPKLVTAIRKGDLALFRKFANGTSDLNQADDIGWTPIFYAVAAGDVQMTSELRDRGARIDIRDNAGWTPLDHAKLDGNEDVRLVLEKAQ